MSKQTTAEEISERFNDDGQCFTDGSGWGLAEACEAQAKWTSIRDKGTRYDFDDGSSIVVVGDAWDIGFDGTDCLCWQGAGHHDECQIVD
jgi:hypothetical protein